MNNTAGLDRTTEGVDRVRPARAGTLAGVIVLLAGCSDGRATHVKSGERPDARLLFVERAAESGLDFTMNFLPLEQGENFKVNLYDHGAGVAVADVDGDGHDDVYLLNQLGSNALYRNRGDGTFENVTAHAGPVDLADRVCVAAVFGDVDSDGDQDLYVTSTRGGNVLLRNDGDGRFEDVTHEAGLRFLGHSQGATFFDFDGDADLDLFVTNTAEWTQTTFDEQSNYFRGKEVLWELVESRPEANVLYRNAGDGTFTPVTEEVGLGGTAWGGDFVVFDYDQDGDPDLVVTNMFGRSRLYRNENGRRFVDVTESVLGATSWGSIGARAFDFDSDGLLDFAIADMHSDMWMSADFDIGLIEPTRKYEHSCGRMAELQPDALDREREIAASMQIDYERVRFGNTLFRNQGDGTFEEVSETANFETFWPWGIATGDFDCDGHEDVFLPSGMGYPFFYWPNAMLRNRGDGTFEDRAFMSGIVPGRGKRHLPERIGGARAARSSRCAAVADFDGDGRLDLIANNFNDTPSYFVNRSPAQPFVAMRLRGTASHRDAIGAVVTLRVGERTLVRQVQAAGGYLAQSSLTIHFGLGDAETVDRCEIRWPSGTTTVHEDVPVGEYLLVRESGTCEVWDR